MLLKRRVNQLLALAGVELRRARVPRSLATIPDADLYRPLYSPWHGGGRFADHIELARPFTLVSADRCHVLATLASQAAGLEGDWVEAGVYRGGTARLLVRLLDDVEPGGTTRLHLFDTFEGMPVTDADLDDHVEGDFADTSLEAVRDRVVQVSSDPDRVTFHPGRIPETFAGLDDLRVALAHVDVDIHRSVADCCEFLYPRLVVGGFLVFDDYGFPSCPGARRAVDDFFNDKPEVPLVLPTGQAVVFRTPAQV